MKFAPFIAITIMGFSFWSCTGPPTGQDANQPNIVFIMSDDHAYQAISAYKSDLIKTPNIDKIAEEGMLFNTSLVTNSLCAPSRAVILTGKFSHLNGIPGNEKKFDGNQQTLPKLLQQNGYRTALIGKWHLKSPPTGFDYWNVLPGQGDYYNPDFIKLGKDTVYSGYVTDIITELSLEWLNRQKKDQPFCLMMHHKAPHRSWMPALENLELFDEKDFPLPNSFYDDYEGRNALKKQLLTVRDHMDIRMDFKVPCNECDTVPVNFWAPSEYWRRLDRLTQNELEIWKDSYKKEETEFHRIRNNNKQLDVWKYRRYLEDYLRCIVSVDQSVGAVLEFLSDQGIAENTIVVYTSDQGFFLGEHGLFDKRFMYEEAMRTPLIIKFPKEIKRNSVTSHLTQNLDIAPTLLDVAGISTPNDMQGKSLRPLWLETNPEWRDAVYYHYYEKGFGAIPHYGVRTDRYKLIHFYDVIDSWELYDLHTDPEERTNLYANANFVQLREEMIEKLANLRRKYLVPPE